MVVNCRGEDRINEEIARLEKKFGDFKVREETAVVDAELFRTDVEKVDSGWMGNARSLVVDDQGRTLLVRHRGTPDWWGSPGGGHEPGETFEETVKREIKEETGIVTEVTDVFYARKQRVEMERDTDQRYSKLIVYFLAEYRSASLSVDESEILEAQWFHELPENTVERLAETARDMEYL